jgi:hypothetical protein
MGDIAFELIADSRNESMNSPRFGQRRVVHPREIWKEELDFSAWLAREDNISILGHQWLKNTAEKLVRVVPKYVDLVSSNQA